MAETEVRSERSDYSLPTVKKLSIQLDYSDDEHEEGEDDHPQAQDHAQPVEQVEPTVDDKVQEWQDEVNVQAGLIDKTQDVQNDNDNILDVQNDVTDQNNNVQAEPSVNDEVQFEANDSAYAEINDNILVTPVTDPVPYVAQEEVDLNPEQTALAPESETPSTATEQAQEKLIGISQPFVENGQGSYVPRAIHESQTPNLSIYPVVYVSPAGILTVIMRQEIAVEMTMDKTLRVVNHKHKAVAAINSRANSSCIYHDAAKVLQELTTTEVHIYSGYKVHMSTDNIVFTNGNSAYDMSLSGLHNRKRKPVFKDLTKDMTVSLLFSSSSYGPDLIPEYYKLAEEATYVYHKRGGVTVFINGMRIFQNSRGDVFIAAGPKFIRMSAQNGTLFLETHFVEIAIEKDRKVKVKRGEQRLGASHHGLLVSDGYREAGYDQHNQILFQPVVLVTQTVIDNMPRLSATDLGYHDNVIYHYEGPQPPQLSTSFGPQMYGSRRNRRRSCHTHLRKPYSSQHDLNYSSDYSCDDFDVDADYEHFLRTQHEHSGSYRLAYTGHDHMEEQQSIDNIAMSSVVPQDCLSSVASSSLNLLRPSNHDISNVLDQYTMNQYHGLHQQSGMPDHFDQTGQIANAVAQMSQFNQSLTAQQTAALLLLNYRAAEEATMLQQSNTIYQRGIVQESSSITSSVDELASFLSMNNPDQGNQMVVTVNSNLAGHMNPVYNNVQSQTYSYSHVDGAGNQLRQDYQTDNQMWQENQITDTQITDNQLYQESQTTESQTWQDHQFTDDQFAPESQMVNDQLFQESQLTDNQTWQENQITDSQLPQLTDNQEWQDSQIIDCQQLSQDSNLTIGLSQESQLTEYHLSQESHVTEGLSQESQLTECQLSQEGHIAEDLSQESQATECQLSQESHITDIHLSQESQMTASGILSQFDQQLSQDSVCQYTLSDQFSQEDGSVVNFSQDYIDPAQYLQNNQAFFLQGTGSVRSLLSQESSQSFGHLTQSDYENLTQMTFQSQPEYSSQGTLDLDSLPPIMGRTSTTTLIDDDFDQLHLSVSDEALNNNAFEERGSQDPSDLSDLLESVIEASPKKTPETDDLLPQLESDATVCAAGDNLLADQAPEKLEETNDQSPAETSPVNTDDV